MHNFRIINYLQAEVYRLRDEAARQEGKSARMLQHILRLQKENALLKKEVADCWEGMNVQETLSEWFAREM